ncbi:hypothetical protein [Streptomyces sp. NPDC055506]
MSRFNREVYGSRSAMRRNAVGAIGAGGCAIVVGLFVVAGGNDGGWVVAAIGTAAVLLVTLLPRVAGRRRD